MPFKASSTLGYDELIIGLASVFGSLIIILTYALFPNLRKLRYVELVFYVAVNDLFASIGLALGAVPNDSAACWYQGISSTVNYISSAFWTTVILFQVYLVVIRNGRVLKDMFWIHVFCWGWPVVLALLPLTTNTYNNTDDESSWCFVASTRHSPPWGELFWVLFSFFVWIWLCMITNCVQIAMIVRKLRNLQVVSDVVRSTVKKLIFYPVITVLCWSLNTAANIYVLTKDVNYASLSTTWDTVATLGIVFAASQGVLNAVVFIAMNTIVREHWAELLFRLYRLLFCCTIDKDRPALRTYSNAADMTQQLSSQQQQATNNVLHKLDPSSAQPKQPHQLKHHLHPEDMHERGVSVDERAGPVSQANIFRDTVLSDAGGMRLSTYFSISLPVEDELDFVGADMRTVEEEQQQGVRESNFFGGFRGSSVHNSHNNNHINSNARRSSLFGYFRSSVANTRQSTGGVTLDQEVGDL